MNMNNESMGVTLKQVGFWAAIIIGITAVVAGMIWLVSLQNKSLSNPNVVVTIPNIIEADDWVKGNRNAQVTLIEYADYQCPACATYAPVVTQLAAEFGANVAFVFRHFPLPQHGNAVPMVYAAEAAGRQGKFWEMTSMIYANQQAWQNAKNVEEIATEYAKTLGMDTAQFQKDFASKELRAKADEQISKNRDLDAIQYTPSFFLNGTRIAPKSYAEFQKMVADAVAASTTQNTRQSTN